MSSIGSGAALPGAAASGPNKRQAPVAQKRQPGLGSGPGPGAAVGRKLPLPDNNGIPPPRKPSSISGRNSSSGERTVKRLRLSKALTIPDGTTVADACRRMATRRVDAALLTDSSALLCGIITDKDVATRVIAEGLKPEDTPVSKVMTRHPIFVMGDTLAVEALQKMVQGKFRHLPVVENGEVVALLDITKCLYDAIARMERAAEKGNAIAAAVEGVERQWGNTLAAPSSFIETLRERMFRPTLGSLVNDTVKVATVSPSDTVYTATRKMRELRVNSVIITTGNKPQGILTSKDVLMRVVASGHPPDTTTVDKVMTPNPECATLDTTIVDALHTMHDGKFLHLPVLNRDGHVVACMDVLQLTHGAVATVGSGGGSGGVPGSTGSDMASTMLQKFWDSALALEPPEDDDDSRSDISNRLASEAAYGSEAGRMGNALLGPGFYFDFKLEDGKGRVHRFPCGTESLTELVSAVVQRVGDDVNLSRLPNLMYEDEDGDKVLLTNDSDLVSAITHARATDRRVLKLKLDYAEQNSSNGHGHNASGGVKGEVGRGPNSTHEAARKEIWSSTHTAVVAGAAMVVGVSLLFYLRRSGSDGTPPKIRWNQ